MINKLQFKPDVAKKFGLDAPLEQLHGLGPLVVLAGPNGAGKSRYLALVRETVEPFYARFASLASHVRRSEIPHGNIQTHEQVERVKKQLDSMRDQATHWGANESRARQFVNLSYSMDKVDIQPLNQLSPTQADQLVQANISPGFPSAHASMHAYVARVATALWNAKHQDVHQYPTVGQATQDAELFNNMLDTLVGGKVSPQVDQNQRIIPLFRGRIFSPAELSNGEVILVTWAIILHRQMEALADAIVLIDEPENHLHPNACINAINALQDKILGRNGQIWLATHSVQLIAFAGMDSIWLVDNGRIEYAGNKVDRVLNRLLGGPEGRDRLHAFLADADQLGFYKFAAECLTDASVAPPKPGDPQEAQFTRLIRERIERGEACRVLDFGAGRGRLATALREARAGRSDESRPVGLEYHAYNGPEASSVEVTECHRRVKELAASPGVCAQYVDDIRSLQLATYSKMDLVVLCNVLHEIPVDQWSALFGILADVLAIDGSVLLMEDQSMTVGELPTLHGFIVLDEIEIAALFGTQPGVDVRALSGENCERLTRIEVRRAVLRNVTSSRVREAMQMVQKRAKREIETLRRKKDRSFQAGRRHAYFSMLYMNATLASEPYT